MPKHTLLDRRHEATRTDILAAAEELMVREGFDQLTMRGLAAEAGCSSATLYQYFKDKQELLTELFGRHFDEFVQAVEEQCAKFTDPLDKLKAHARAGWELFDLKNSLIRQFVQQLPPTPAGPSEHLTGERRERFLAFEAHTVALIRECQLSGRIRDDLTAEQLHRYFIHHLVATREMFATEPDRRLAEECVRLSFSLLAEGLKIQETDHTDGRKA